LEVLGHLLARLGVESSRVEATLESLRDDEVAGPRAR